MGNDLRVIDRDTGEILDNRSDTQEMAIRLGEMKNKLELMKHFFEDILVPNMDYGIIPGTNKTTLYKPGAEKLCELYNYSINITDLQEVADRETGYYQATVTITLVHRKTGEIAAQGIGSANTMEARYRWRWVYENQLPPGIDKSALVSKNRQNRRGSYTVFRIENDDLWTLWNTILKMAKKRALVDATLSATRSSGMFADDIDDENESDSQRSNRSSVRSPRQTRDTSNNPKMCTEKQAKLIRDLVGGDEDILGFSLHSLFGVSEPEKLTREQASQAITKLKEQQKSNQGDVPK